MKGFTTARERNAEDLLCLNIPALEELDIVGASVDVGIGQHFMFNALRIWSMMRFR
jgi:hypothetical protein